MLLTACSSVPEEVSRDNEILNSATPIDKEEIKTDNLERLSMGEIRNSIEKTLSENNTNVLPGKVIVGDTDAMPAYKIAPYNDNLDFSKIVKYLMNEEFTLESPNCFYYKKGDKDDNGDTFTTDRVYYIGEKQINTAGFLAVTDGQMRFDSAPQSDARDFAFIAPTEKRYRLRLGDELDDSSYELLEGGGEWSVKDAADFAVNFFNEYIAPLEKNEFTYAVTEFRVKRVEDGLAYVVNLQRLKDGNRIDNHYCYCNFVTGSTPMKDEDRSWYDKGYPYLYDGDMQVSFLEKEKVFSFIKLWTPYEGEQVDNGEKLISLKQAIEIVSANMADKSVQEFEYTELTDFYVALDCNNYDDMGNKVDNCMDMLDNSDIQLRPYWAFVKKDCWPDMQGGYGGDNEPVKYHHLYLVDAITGQFILL